MNDKPITPNHKIKPHHLNRRGKVYVRQSTPYAVREHTTSGELQYLLKQRAIDFGWAESDIDTIDQDQGQSGASIVNREGFKAMLAEIVLGQVGAVFGREVSRFARDCTEWFSFIKMCYITDTLIIDEEAVYNPRDNNDRLLLGFKGTLSEYELHLIINRFQSAKLEKARKGQLRLRLPIGYIRDRKGMTIFDPNPEVQQAVQLVIELFEQYGSGRAVVRHFIKHNLTFPYYELSGPDKGETRWGPLLYGRVCDILKNPAYAGAYAYGRCTLRSPSEHNGTHILKSRKTHANPEEWLVLHKNVHPAYITWEQYLQNKHKLFNNRNSRKSGSQGAPRNGAALLHGIILCGKCGANMNTQYLKSGKHPTYVCNKDVIKAIGSSCQYIVGSDIDKAIARLLLEQIKPAQLEISLDTLKLVEEESQRVERQWKLQCQRAIREVDDAKKDYESVKKKNRHVVELYENELNAKIEALKRLEREPEELRLRKTHALTEADKDAVRSLAQDFSKVWFAETTTQIERKRLLRFLISDVTIAKVGLTVHLGVRWKTGACTSLEVPYKTTSDFHRTDPEAMKLIRELAVDHTDREIAERLNKEGLKTKTGKTFNKERVRSLRYINDISTQCPTSPRTLLGDRRSDGLYSLDGAARALNVTRNTIYTLINQGCLKSESLGHRFPRWIKLTPELIAELKQPDRKQRNRAA